MYTQKSESSRPDVEPKRRVILRSLKGEGFLTTVPNADGYCVGTRNEALLFSSEAHAQCFLNFIADALNVRAQFEIVNAKIMGNIIYPVVSIEGASYEDIKGL